MLDFDFLPIELAKQYPYLSTFTSFEEYLKKKEDSTMLDMYVTAFDRYMAHLSGGRTLFVTEQGYVGLSTNNLVKPGDDLIILLGCSIPVVLRAILDKSGDLYKFVSDCFVSNMVV